jgi:predicted metal-dependent hydrolase
LHLNLRFHVKEAEYRGAKAAFLEAKTVISNEAAKGFQRMKSNHAVNAK